MTDYELTFIVETLTEKVEHSILDAFAGILGTTHTGDHYVTVVATDTSAEAAAKAMHLELVGLGVVVRRLEYDLVTRSEIAERLKQTPQAVGNWIRGARRAAVDPFPHAFNEVKGGVWLWADVVRWVRLALGTDPMDGIELPSREEITEFNGCLYRSYQAAPAPLFTYPPMLEPKSATSSPHTSLIEHIARTAISKHMAFPGAFRVVPQPRDAPWATDTYFAVFDERHGSIVIKGDRNAGIAYVDPEAEDRVEH